MWQLLLIVTISAGKYEKGKITHFIDWNQWLMKDIQWDIALWIIDLFIGGKLPGLFYVIEVL